MRTVTILILFVSLAATQSCYCQGKSISGQYITLGYHSGSILWLNKDFSFTYRYRGHIFSDTAAGFYRINGDTILLKYHYNNYDSLIADFRANNKEVPVDILFDAGHIDHRPANLLIKGKKLYYIDVASRQLKTYMEKGKSKKLFLRRYR